MMPYLYPDAKHERKHGPCGYTDYTQYKPWLRDEFSFRCVYCLHRERWSHSGDAVFSTDHFVAQSVDTTLQTEYDNLVYACSRCNSYKQANNVLDPCSVAFAKVIRINYDGSIDGLTSEAKQHIMILGLDDPKLVEFRGRLIRTIQALTQSSESNLVNSWLAYPDDLPRLPQFRPPGGNQRPGGLSTCTYELRKNRMLADVYL